MNIKGKYWDVLFRNGKLIKDFGWKSNEIVEDYGRFLAALMKKDFDGQVGIEFIAVGNYDDFDTFKDKVAGYFNWLNKGNSGPRWERENKKWVWAKKIIAVNDIKYLGPEDKEVDSVTNRLKIDVVFERNEPSDEIFDFKEFALLGINKSSNTFLTDRMFPINYVNHGQIIKDKNMKLSRTIKLTFPIEGE